MLLNKNEFEDYLNSSIDGYLYKADGSTPKNLADSIRYSLTAPGKRIRPRLLLATSRMLEIPTAAAMPAALALEMAHCFTLIHDDLPCMDNDDFRRGLPSNHKKFGEAVALLAGDSLLPLATEVFLDSQLNTQRLLAGLKYLTWAIGPRGVIGGQAAEIILDSQAKLEDLRLVHFQKTGALFLAALLIPREFAGILPRSPEGQAIEQFGQKLGLAFQAADDLEDRPKHTRKDLEPSHILFYLSEEEVRRSTIQQLNHATDLVARHWGEKAQELREIADEVIQKIQSA